VDTIDAGVDWLPEEADRLGFAVCRAMGLPKRKVQRMLVCGMEEPLMGMGRILERIGVWNDRLESDKDGGNGSNFVSRAVRRIFLLVVSVELSNGENEQKAAGLIAGGDGIIANICHGASPPQRYLNPPPQQPTLVKSSSPSRMAHPSPSKYSLSSKATPFPSSK